jgi:beta-mannosidase
MNSHPLNGQWTLTRADQPEFEITANVPGCVHIALLAAEKIEDPYFRTNEQDVQWIGETDWIYSRQFTVSDELLSHDKVLLHCDGLDTLATITINDTVISKTDNMFRTWEFDVKEHLVMGKNNIQVYFDAPVLYINAKYAERRLPAAGEGHNQRGCNWIRKEPCNFGWDWGPMLATSGIWRNISLLAINTARIADVHISQDHSTVNKVLLTVKAAIERTIQAAVTAKITVSFDDQIINESDIEFSHNASQTEIAIEQPQLWWPNGMGEQPLYIVKIELYDESGAVLDNQSKRIGLRVLKLERHDDQWGESFYFSANSVPFFSKGANWIPADTFATRVTHDDYSRLLQDTVAANMNMLRVWGGAIYEEDVFYEMCDELGICIWQDFMFSCATYPTFDDTFMTSVKAEAEDNVRRIRHHACLALWCGNNELEQELIGPEWTDSTMSWEDYGKLFDDLLLEVVTKLDPQRDYWPSSPHTPRGDRQNDTDPTCGDAHLWNVWHGQEPFEWYRTCEHRFNSEFGFQSFPNPQTVATYTLPQDRNITSFVMEHHQRSGIGNSTIIHYMLDWFRLPESFDMILWLSQILQGMAMKYAVEHWRRSMPRGMGTLYWQLNDCWQVASWSSIDYFGNWKALHHMARHFYAPLLVSGLEDWDTGTVEIHVTSDLLQDTSGTVLWTLTDANGKHITDGQEDVTIAANANTPVKTLQFTEQMASHGARNLIFWLELQIDDQTVATNLVLFARPKHLELAQSQITAKTKEKSDGNYQLQLASDQVALWVWLESEVQNIRFSDNFFHLQPGKVIEIDASTAQKLSEKEFTDSLSIRSLVDTYHG